MIIKFEKLCYNPLVYIRHILYRSRSESILAAGSDDLSDCVPQAACRCAISANSEPWPHTTALCNALTPEMVRMPAHEARAHSEFARHERLSSELYSETRR